MNDNGIPGNAIDLAAYVKQKDAQQQIKFAPRVTCHLPDPKDPNDKAEMQRLYQQTVECCQEVAKVMLRYNCYRIDACIGYMS